MNLMAFLISFALAVGIVAAILLTMYLVVDVAHTRQMRAGIITISGLFCYAVAMIIYTVIT